MIFINVGLVIVSIQLISQRVGRTDHSMWSKIVDQNVSIQLISQRVGRRTNEDLGGQGGFPFN